MIVPIFVLKLSFNLNVLTPWPCTKSQLVSYSKQTACFNLSTAHFMICKALQCSEHYFFNYLRSAYKTSLIFRFQRVGLSLNR